MMTFFLLCAAAGWKQLFYRHQYEYPYHLTEKDQRQFKVYSAGEFSCLRQYSGLDEDAIVKIFLQEFKFGCNLM